MRAKELQVGDWVELKFGGEYPDEIRFVGMSDISNICFLKCANPIQISSEMLEKNRFIKQNEYEYKLDKEVMVQEVGNGKWIVTIDKLYGDKASISIKYVHELQRILRIFNIDKEIDL